jgi:aminocarboxymuconate-semialdehyde decarboxylase
MTPIDVHAHWYPQRFLDLLGREGPAHGLEWREIEGKGPQFRIGHLVTGPAGPGYVDLDARLEAMDGQGVAAHALSLSQPMVYWAGRELGERLAATFNEELARAHERAPQRLVGLATLPMQEPGVALRELERAARLEKELSDESFFGVYERLEALGLPLFLHPVHVIDPQRLQRFYLTNLLGNPFESAIAAAHLIFGGVLDRFPALQVVLPHAGGAFPWLAGRLNRGWEKRDELRSASRSPLEYLRRFHYDTIGYSASVLEYLVRVVGADRVVMGSDYCFPIAYERPVEVITENAALSGADQRLILETNAKRLLRL